MKKFELFFRFTGSLKALGFFEATVLMEMSLKGIYVRFVFFMVFTRANFELSCGQTSSAPAGTSTDFRVRFEAYSEGMAAIGKKILKGIDEFQKKVEGFQAFLYVVCYIECTVVWRTHLWCPSTSRSRRIYHMA